MPSRAVLGWLIMCTSGVFYFAKVLGRSPRN